MNLDEARTRLLSLDLPVGDFAVFGSGPLLARGIIEDVNDLDVLARGGAWELARSTGETVFLAEYKITIASFYDGLITVGTSWAIGSFDIDMLIDTADMIDGIPYVALDHVILYKRVAARPKDQEHLRRSQEWLDSGPVGNH